MTRLRRRRQNGERGAALVEFALLLPVFMMLVLGMFSGGLAYNQKLSMNHSAREVARFGATFPETKDDWAESLVPLVIERATGDVDASHDICVALIEGSSGTASTVSATAALSSDHSTASGSSACFFDGDGDTGKRVQVSMARPSKIEALFFNMDVTLTSRATARFEGD